MSHEFSIILTNWKLGHWGTVMMTSIKDWLISKSEKIDNRTHSVIRWNFWVLMTSLNNELSRIQPKIRLLHLPTTKDGFRSLLVTLVDGAPDQQGANWDSQITCKSNQTDFDQISNVMEFQSSDFSHFINLKSLAIIRGCIEVEFDFFQITAVGIKAIDDPGRKLTNCHIFTNLMDWAHSPCQNLTDDFFFSSYAWARTTSSLNPKTNIVQVTASFYFSDW